MGGTVLFALQVAFSVTRGCGGCGTFAICAGTADTRFGAGALAGRRASSKVPHIPQKRKLSELSSPHFGQVTMVLQISFRTV
jgi:hypothetical protein